MNGLRSHRSVRTVLGVVTWGVAIGMVWGLVRAVPLAEAWGALGQLDGVAVLVLVLMNVLVLMGLNGRWWVILVGLGYRLPFFKLLGHRLAAFGVSYFTPGPHFGGEPVQVLLVEREHGVPRVTAVAAVTLDKTLELVVNFTFLLGGVTAVLQGQLIGGVGVEALLFALFLLAMPGLLLLAIWQEWFPISRLVGWVSNWSLWHRIGWQARLQRIQSGVQCSEVQAAQFCQQSPGAFWGAFAISVVGWLLLIAEYWLMLRFLGLMMTPLQAIALITAARIAILLPLPGGLGTLEASQVLALGAMGEPTAVGISISLLIRVRDVALGLLGLWWGMRYLPGWIRPFAKHLSPNK